MADLALQIVLFPVVVMIPLAMAWVFTKLVEKKKEK